MIDVTVSRKRSEATDIVSYELARRDGGSLPPFTAGAHIDVHLPNGLVRQYSLCNPPGASDRYRIAVLREPSSGGGSIALQDQVQEGDSLTISEPRNHFELAPDARENVLLAGGIGITPILCMAEQLARDGAEFQLHYCARSPERMAFHDYIRDSAFADRASFHFDDGPEAQRLRLEEVLGAPAPERHLYVCGPTGFIDYVLAAAQAAGWSSEQIHREYFTPDPAALEGGSSFRVKLASTGDVFTIPEDRSVVEVLADAGIEVLVSCEQGMCGSCVTNVLELEGELDHRDMFLSEKQHAEGKVMTPCCSRASAGSLVVLDI